MVDAAQRENHQTHLFIANCKPESRILGKPKDEVLYVVKIGRASCRERSVDLGGRRIIKKKRK